MKKIKFSVLMSIYKNDKIEYVKIAINSILNQTLKPEQYVIMIDGPIDEDLKKLLLMYEKENDIVELHFRKENKGLGITLNEGLNYCKYEYVARMDADDYSEKDRFEKQINFLEKNKNVSVLGCSMIEYDDKLQDIKSFKNVPETNNEIRKYIKIRNPINHPTVIFKKKDVLNSGSYEDYLFFEDYYLWAKMISNGFVFHNLNEHLYRFRGGNSMYGRRGGFKYIKHIHKFEKGLLELKLINYGTYMINLFVRVCGAIVPNEFRKQLYIKLLRSSNK